MRARISAATSTLLKALTEAKIARQATIQVSWRGDARLPQRPVCSLHSHAGPPGLQQREERVGGSRRRSAARNGWLGR